MTDAEHSPEAPSTATGRPSREAAAPEGSSRQESPDYDGPGAWGPAALWLLGGLFVISAALTVHSMLATFGGP